MLKKIFSIFGIIAIVAFFLPWLRGCEQVQSGFELLILSSLKNVSASSLSSLNTGLLFLLVPFYVTLVALIIKYPNAPVKLVFAVLSFLSFWNIGIWSGMIISAVTEEWGAETHAHAVKLSKLGFFEILSALFLIIFIFRWVRKKSFNLGYSCAVLIIPIFPLLAVGYTIQPNFYGMWIYSIALSILLLGAIIEGFRTSQAPSTM